MSLIVSRIPSAIGSPGSTAFTGGGPAYDVAIAGIPFLSAISTETPYIRESSPSQKQQFDTGARAGERSLTDWWRRSQASFHGGAGLRYAEPDGPTDPVADIRFWSSKNLDVWTPGQVTRLPDTTQAVVAGAALSGLATGTSGGVNYVLYASTNVLSRWNGTSATAYTWGGTNTILSLAVDGSKYYVADITGIYSGPIDGSAPGALLWNNATTRVKLSWVKQRLMCGQNNKVYELIGAGPGLPATKYTHPDTGWTWTDFADGPTSILASGYSGGDSAIHEFVLAGDGSSPVLVAGRATPMPPGELVYALHAYVGSALGIGTSRGIRVGQFSNGQFGGSGSWSYGPLTVETSQPVRSITGRDRFLFAPATAFIDGETCLVRIDLSQPVDQAGRFAYASDLLCPTAQTATGSWVALTATGKLVFTVDAYGVVLEGTGAGSSRSAWLETSRIRMATVEPKLYRRLWVRGTFASPGTVGVTVTGSSGEVVTALPPFSSPSDIDEVSVIQAAQEWVSLHFDLNLSGAIDFRGYVLKAVPATPPRRLYQIPVLMNDNEVDRFNTPIGYPGYAITRLLQLEEIEDSQDEVRLELFTSEGTLARQCTIHQLSYRQVHQPGQTGTVGGVLVVTLKTVS